MSYVAQFIQHLQFKRNYRKIIEIIHEIPIKIVLKPFPTQHRAKMNKRASQLWTMSQTLEPLDSVFPKVVR